MRQLGAQGTRCAFRVRRFGEGPHHNDARRARCHHLGHARTVNAPNGEPRLHGCRCSDPSHQFQSRSGTPRLRRRRPDRPDGEVVDLGITFRLARLREDVRRTPDQHGVAHQMSRLRGGEIVLPDMHHVDVSQHGDVRTIVDATQGAVPLRSGTQHGDVLEGFARLHRLVAELHDVHAAGEDGVEEVRELLHAAVSIGTAVQAGRREAFTA